MSSNAAGAAVEARSGTSLVLLVDLPVGFALDVLERGEQPAERVVVVTANPCPEYCEDLWAFGPAGLVASRELERAVPEALTRVTQGAAAGIKADIGQLAITHSTIRENAGVGVLANCQQTTIRSSIIASRPRTFAHSVQWWTTLRLTFASRCCSSLSRVPLRCCLR